MMFEVLVPALVAIVINAIIIAFMLGKNAERIEGYKAQLDIQIENLSSNVEELRKTVRELTRLISK